MQKREKVTAEDLVTKLGNLKVFLDQNDEPHALVRVGRAYQVLAIGSREFRRFIVKRTWNLTSKVLPAGTINSIVTYLDAQAGRRGRRIPLEVRFARRGKVLWLDLADRYGRAAKVTADGWKVVRHRRIIFRRYGHQRPIEKPDRNGDVREIFEYLNLIEDQQKVLVLAWLGCAFVADLPRPILFLGGPQGSAKTTQAKVLRSLIDPSAALTVQLPSNSAELAQILQHHAVPLFDNLTKKVRLSR